MKRILLIAAILFTTACDATTTVYHVECVNPFKLAKDDWSEKEVKYAYTAKDGTRVVLNDGRIIDYSQAIACVVDQREVEDK